MNYDTVSDLIVRIKNAVRTRREHVDVPLSNLRRHIAEVLQREEFLEKFIPVDDGRHGALRLFLRYGPGKEPVIKQIRRISRPGRRVYKGCTEMPRVRRGFGIGVYSTPKGVLSDAEARRQKVGGEYLCEVW
ncbi:MAG: 30S ribosomal protein S8 [Nitrospirae bacterium]|nr:30S ribosomal protein S8 [Nitrospirota bacterium]